MSVDTRTSRHLINHTSCTHAIWTLLKYSKFKHFKQKRNWKNGTFNSHKTYGRATYRVTLSIASVMTDAPELMHLQHRHFNVFALLSHCGLVTPYDHIHLSQHWLRQWLVAWWHQTITWTNFDEAGIRSSNIHQRAISWERPPPSITKISLKTTYLKFHTNPQGPMS